MSRKEPNRNVYVGHRYVPLILGEWDKKVKYEGLSVVLHEGASYTSKGYVPVGIDIKNDKYWALTGNYNAQVEHYRQAVYNLEEDVIQNKSDSEQADTALGNRIDTVTSDFKQADTALGNRIDTVTNDFKQADTALGNRIDTVTTNFEQADTALGNRIDDVKDDFEQADTALGNRIDTVTSDFKQADTALGNRIDNNNDRLDNIRNDINLSNEIIPLEILNSSTPSENIMNFINNKKNKRFIFPYGVKVTLEKQLVIQNLENCYIDFNHVDFTVPNNSQWEIFYIDEFYISRSALVLCNSEKLITKNIKINGNMMNNSDLIIGLLVFNLTDYDNYDLNIRNVNYHPIHIEDNTKRVNFNGHTKFLNNCAGVQGNSDVFVSNLPGDNYYFENVHSERDNHISGQIFYVNGHNGIVDNITGKNTGAPYDARIGTHHVKNINIDGCETIIVQSYPSATVNERPTLKIDVLNVSNIEANSTTGASLMFVTSCHRLDIGKIFVSGKSGSSHNWNVLRISNRPNDLFYPENINIGSIIGSGTTSNGILLSDMTDDVRIGYVEMKVNNREAHAFSITGDSDGKLIVDDFKVDGFNYGLIAGNGRTKLLTSKKFLERGTTEERPVNIPNTQTHLYFDTTLNIPIIWNSNRSAWVSLDGSVLE